MLKDKLSFVSKTSHDFILNFLKIKRIFKKDVFFLLCLKMLKIKKKNVENHDWSDKLKVCYKGKFSYSPHKWQITAEERNFYIQNFVRVAQSCMNKNSIKITLDWTLDWSEKY